jgi:hypothetical protein
MMQSLADGALTGDDLLGEDDVFSGAEDPMFEPVEIHNFDPFAYLDTKDQKRRKLSEMLSEADEKAKKEARPVLESAGALNPEEIDIESDSEHDASGHDNGVLLGMDQGGL